jgi:hypothetical protein
MQRKCERELRLERAGGNVPKYATPEYAPLIGRLGIHAPQPGLNNQRPCQAAAVHAHYSCNNTLERSPMRKKLTITVDELVYDGLYRVVGPRRISQFIEDLVRPHVIAEDLLVAYAAMAADEVRESDADEWSESLMGVITGADLAAAGCLRIETVL